LQALGRLGGVRSLQWLLRAASDPSLSNSRGRAVAAAFSTALDATSDLPAALATLREQEADSLELLAELCRVAHGDGGRVARAELLGDEALSRRARAALALESARRGEPPDAGTIAAWLRDAPLPREAPGSDEGLTAALLVLLYAAEGDAGLERGAEVLGLELRRPGQARLREVARLVVAGPDGRRDLGRMEALLRLAP
jgi:hypothetical protein